MDYRSQLSRFLQRRVCVDLWGHNTIWGTLSSIHEDHLRLVDTIVQGDREGHGWFEQMQFGSDDAVGGPRNAETIVRLDTVLHVTYADDDLPAEMDEMSEDGEGETAGIHQTNSENDRWNMRLIDVKDPPRRDADVETAVEPPLMIYSDRLKIEFGIRLVPLVDAKVGGDLIERLRKMRTDLSLEMGVILPRIRVVDRRHVDDWAYRFLINEHAFSTGEVMIDRLLATDLDGFANLVEGREATDPMDGQPAKWIDAELRDLVIHHGGCVAEPTAVIAKHFSVRVRSVLHELISYEDVAQLVQDLKANHWNVVSDLIPAHLSVLVLHRFLKLLLEERVSIRHLIGIIESVAFHLGRGCDHDTVLQCLRVDIGRAVCDPFLNDGRLCATMLDTEMEDTAIQLLKSEQLSKCDTTLLEFVDSLSSMQREPAVVVRHPKLRRPLFEALRKAGRRISVISESEIPCGVQLG
ncbi:MAG: FHIPEP family type III secretion protein [Pirellulaceae bacterium]